MKSETDARVDLWIEKVTVKDQRLIVKCSADVIWEDLQPGWNVEPSKMAIPKVIFTLELSELKTVGDYSKLDDLCQRAVFRSLGMEGRRLRSMCEWSRENEWWPNSAEAEWKDDMRAAEVRAHMIEYVIAKVKSEYEDDKKDVQEHPEDFDNTEESLASARRNCARIRKWLIPRIKKLPDRQLMLFVSCWDVCDEWSRGKKQQHARSSGKP